MHLHLEKLSLHFFPLWEHFGLRLTEPCERYANLFNFPLLEVVLEKQWSPFLSVEMKENLRQYLSCNRLILTLNIGWLFKFSTLLFIFIWPFPINKFIWMIISIFYFPFLLKRTLHEMREFCICRYRVRVNKKSIPRIF